MLNEEILIEILDSTFQVHHDETIKNTINSQLGSKVYPAHTRVMHSDHMKEQGHSVLRIMNHKRQVEYHFLQRDGNFDNHTFDRKSMHHALKIIHDDAKETLKSGKSVALQARTEEQHHNYGKLANRLVKSLEGKKVKDVGPSERLDGHGLAKTHIIEGLFDSQIPKFKDFIKDFK
jgi:hypothetical protein